MKAPGWICSMAACVLLHALSPGIAHAGRAPGRPWLVPPDPTRLTSPDLRTIEVDGLEIRWVQAPAPSFEARLLMPIPDDMPVAASLLQSVLFRTEGTSACPGAEWPVCLAREGVAFDAAVDADFLTLTVRSDAEQAREALALLGELVVHPRITEQGLSRARLTLREWVASRLNDPLAVATDRLFRQLFGAHPYASQIEYAAIASISFEDMSHWRRITACPDRSLLVTAAPVGEDTLRAWVASSFSGWQSCTDDEATDTPRGLVTPVPDATGVRLEAHLAGDRTAVAVGRALDVSDCEQVAVAGVVAQLVSQRLRNVAPADADVGAEARVYRAGGAWWAWAGASSADDTDSLWEATARIRRGEVTRREINEAVRAEIAVTLEAADSLAVLAALEARSARSSTCAAGPSSYLAWLQKVSPGRIAVLAQKLLDLETLVVVSCGPQSGMPGDTGTAVGLDDTPEPGAPPPHP